jgi:hypothetical protein
VGGEEPGPCPSGTYKFYWDGDYPDHENYACVNSGNSTQDIAAQDGDHVNSTGGESGQGFQKTAADQYNQWTITNSDIFDATQGTVWYSLYYVADGGETTRIWEQWKDNNNNVDGRLEIAEVVQNFHEDPVAGNQVIASSLSLSAQTWYRVGYTWQADTGADTHCYMICDSSGANCTNSGSWTCEDSIGDYTGEDELRIGALEGIDNSAHEIHIDAFYVTGGYQDADPKF